MNLNNSNIVLFSVQVALIFVVVIVSLVNLSLEWGNQNLWTVVLTSCLGYIMTNTKIKIIRNCENVIKENSNDDN